MIATTHQPGFDEFWTSFAPVFDSLLPPRSVPDAFREFVNRLNLRSDARVLDMGCGTGRHLLKLSDTPYDLVGVDVCHESLLIAGERASALGRTVETRQLDILDNAPMIDDGTFDVVMCLGATPTMVPAKSLGALLVRMRHALLQGGVAILEIHNRSAVERLHAGSDTRDLVFGEHSRAPVEGTSRWDANSSTWTIDYRFITEEGMQTARERAHVPSLETVCTLANEAGFTLRSGNSDWAGTDLHEQDPLCILTFSLTE